MERKSCNDTRAVCHILHLGITRIWVVCFTLRRLYPRAKRFCYPLQRKLDVSPSHSGESVKGTSFSVSVFETAVPTGSQSLH